MASSAERIVVNSGPLISLADAGALDVLARIPAQFICPPQVRAELDDGESRGHGAVQGEWLRVVPLTGPLQQPLPDIELDTGEAAVIQLALEQGIGKVCLDDLKGRGVASALGLTVTGSLGLLLSAKNLGLVPAIRPLFQQALDEGNWYHPGLVRRVLESAGEWP